MDEVIVKNAARCLSCGDEVESRHRYDFRACSCGNIFVDGGTEYLRRGFTEGALFEDTSILAPEEPRSHVLEHSGIHVGGVHHSALCEGRPCTIHNRSDHAMRSWPQVWHLGRVMRVCKHGANHADPDSPPGARECLPEWCDGCCKKNPSLA